MISSCDKTVPEVLDFRIKFVGKYEVTEEIKSHGPPPPACWDRYSLKDTIISVGYGAADTEISLLNRTVEIDENGSGGDSRFSLSFRNDSIWVGIRAGGLGCGVTTSYRGIKISN